MLRKLLTAPASRPPVVTTSVNNGGIVEKVLMMVIVNNRRRSADALRLGIIATAFCLLPSGLASAQDFKAVEQRLGGAVEAGELTLEQASIMLEALKRFARSENQTHSDTDIRKQRYMVLAENIEAAVADGKLSKEDAQAKLIALRKDMFGDGSGNKDHAAKSTDRDIEARKQRYMQFTEQIKAAVADGKLTKEDAEAKLLALRKDMFGEGSGKKDHAQKSTDRDIEAHKQRYMEFAEQIEAAVRTGKLSKEEAEKKMITLRKKMFGDEGGQEARSDKTDDGDMEARKRRFEEAAKRIKTAVKNGDLSADEGKQKLGEIRKDLFGESD